jgi:hypothetical protein
MKSAAVPADGAAQAVEMKKAATTAERIGSPSFREEAMQRRSAAKTVR